MNFLIYEENFLFFFISASYSSSTSIFCQQLRLSRSRIHERTVSLRFLGIILRVLRLEVSVYNVYITNQFKSLFWGRGEEV
jgi:hypothetical protein